MLKSSLDRSFRFFYPELVFVTSDATDQLCYTLKATMENPKGDLIEYCRARKLRLPKFETRGTGSDHEPLFITDILVNDEVKATGQGHSKRDSERTAAELALEMLIAQFGPLVQRDNNREQRRPHPKHANRPDQTVENWPIYAELLSQSLVVANSRVDSNRRGPESIDLVRKLTIDLYKGLLEDLGATET